MVTAYAKAQKTQEIAQSIVVAAVRIAATALAIPAKIAVIARKTVAAVPTAVTAHVIPAKTSAIAQMTAEHLHRQRPTAPMGLTTTVAEAQTVLIQTVQAIQPATVCQRAVLAQAIPSAAVTSAAVVHADD